MSKAKDGDTVRVHYTGTLKDGEVFDSSSGGDPLEFKLGSDTVIPGFEAGVVSMEVGEKKSISILCKDAYGERDEKMFLNIERAQLPDEIKPEVGLTLGMNTESGHAIPVKITEVTDETITVDANHPLAGEDLNFELELVEIL